MLLFLSKIRPSHASAFLLKIENGDPDFACDPPAVLPSSCAPCREQDLGQMSTLAGSSIIWGVPIAGQGAWSGYQHSVGSHHTVTAVKPGE